MWLDDTDMLIYDGICFTNVSPVKAKPDVKEFKIYQSAGLLIKFIHTTASDNAQVRPDKYTRDMQAICK